MTKKELRKKAKELRNSIAPEEVKRLSELIHKRLFEHPWFVNSNTIFVYVSTGNEVKTAEIIEKALNDGKTVCVPRVIPHVKMEAVPIDGLDDLRTGFFNIMEPKPDLLPLSENKIDLVIVPGLLFDMHGFRVGYGGGYYDRFLARIPSDCRTLGLAFDFQVVDELPAEDHDMKIMAVITDKRVIVF